MTTHEALASAEAAVRALVRHMAMRHDIRVGDVMHMANALSQMIDHDCPDIGRDDK